MIEFNGYISGAAKKGFWRTNRIMGLKIIFIACLLVFPGILIWSLKTENWNIAIFSGVLLVTLPLVSLIPREKKALTPKYIVIDEEFITCKTDTSGEVRCIEDVKEVKDHGEFYELVFPLGKVSSYFICQKDLLTKGTLEEFEALFDGKIKKV